MSTAEKIHRFALYVQGEPMKVNAIQTIENAITGSKLNLKTQYEVGKNSYVQVCKIKQICNKNNFGHFLSWYFRFFCIGITGGRANENLW